MSCAIRRTSAQLSAGLVLVTALSRARPGLRRVQRFESVGAWKYWLSVENCSTSRRSSAMRASACRSPGSPRSGVAAGLSRVEPVLHGSASRPPRCPTGRLVVAVRDLVAEVDGTTEGLVERFGVFDLRIGGHVENAVRGRAAMIPDRSAGAPSKCRKLLINQVILRFRCLPWRARRRMRGRRQPGPGVPFPGAPRRFPVRRPARGPGRSRPGPAAPVPVDIRQGRLEQRTLLRSSCGTSANSRCRSRSVCCRSFIAFLRQGVAMSVAAAGVASLWKDRTRYVVATRMGPRRPGAPHEFVHQVVLVPIACNGHAVHRAAGGAGRLATL